MLPQKLIQDHEPLAALGAWRYTQGIYRFDPDILDAVAATSMHGDLPVEVLFRLPEWCVYIETPGLVWDKEPLYGFFAFLDWDIQYNHARLYFVTHTVEGLSSGLCLYLGAWTLTEALERLFATAKENAEADGNAAVLDYLSESRDRVDEIAGAMSGFVALLLYICSDEPDIQGYVPGIYPQRPQPKKVKGEWKLFPPDKPRIWRIGDTLGEALREARETATASSIAGQETGSRPRPHIRRAHWHGFWSGPKKPALDSGSARRFRYQWLPPIIVGGGEDV